MLSGDYFTYEIKSSQSGGSSHCRCCDTGKTESLLHIITECNAYQEIRNRIYKEIQALVNKSNLRIEEIFENKQHLTQFILDPSSLNLPYRMNQSDTNLREMMTLSRDYCFALNSQRIKILKDKTLNINR